MAQTTLSVRIDEKVKKAFDRFCTEIGMNTSVAINLFIKTVIRENKIPFELTLEKNDKAFYSKENIEHLKKSIEILEKGRGKKHELIEVEDEQNME